MATSSVSEANVGTSYSASSHGRIAHGAAIAITERLAELPDLALPSSMYKDAAQPPSTDNILMYLQALLKKDPAAFLARYGNVLQSQELNHFEPLRSSDFEVDHWLGYFAAQQMVAADQVANPRRLPARVKNRRLAAMQRLVAQGEYFSDDAMRDRAPLLYHQHIGQYLEAEPEAPDEEQREAGDKLKQMQAGGHDAGALVQGLSGGLGGSCLAAALQQTLGRVSPGGQGAGAEPRDEGCRKPARMGEAPAWPSDSGPAARVGSASSPAGTVRPPPGADHPHPTGTTAAGEASGRTHTADRGDGGGGQEGGWAGAAQGLRDMEVEEGALAKDGAAARFVRGGCEAAAGSSQAAAARGPPAELPLSELLMRQSDEAQLVMRRMQEQQEEEAQLSEHDSDDDDDDSSSDESMSDGGAPPDHRPRRHRRSKLSASDLARMRRSFIAEMESRFLLGHDGQYVDYGAIDADASLDGDWIEQESRDAEEKYFDED